MSDAIEGADVMLYGVTLAYKGARRLLGAPALHVGLRSVCFGRVRQLPHGGKRESRLLSDTMNSSIFFPTFFFSFLTFCSLAQYAHQTEVDMIPLLMSKGYKPKGWLGMLLGCVS
jgi:hypothetical protein